MFKNVILSARLERTPFSRRRVAPRRRGRHKSALLWYKSALFFRRLRANGGRVTGVPAGVRAIVVILRSGEGVAVIIVFILRSGGGRVHGLASGVKITFVHVMASVEAAF